MPRGGKREGAGRKPVLDAWERLAVGAACEALWREAWAAAYREAVDRATARLRREWARAQAIPPETRAQWLRGQEGGDYIDDVDFARREDAGMADADIDLEAPRLLRVRPPRPKGKRQGIVEQVAWQKTEALGRTVSARMATECWKEFRRVQGSLPGI